MKSISCISLPPKGGRPWETPPEPIGEHLIAETLEADVAVIGAGLSGLAAGARCTQMGMSVIIVERSHKSASRAELIAALDSPVMRSLGISIDKKQFARDWLAVSGSRVNEELLWLYINRSGEAFEWLLNLAGGGVEARIMAGCKIPGIGEYHGSHYILKKEDCTKYASPGGGMLICEILEKELINNAGRIIRSTRVEQLEKDEAGRVVAFIAKGEDGKYRRYRGTRAVILATGDIGGDAEMLEAFCPMGLKPEKNLYRPTGLNTGDGHKMAYWAGAAFDNPAWALSLRNSAFCEYSFFFLHVNRLGRRFMNEDTYTQAKAVRCLMQPGGDYAFTIMDSDWFAQLGERFEHIGEKREMPLSLSGYGDRWDSGCGLDREVERCIENGLGARADTLEELAERIGVPAEVLLKTVARYNEIVEIGDDVDFGKRKELLTGIVKPPFYALKWGPAMTGVFGGVLINTHMNALGSDMKPISGLYAVGSVSGGLYGVDYPPLMVGTGCGRALTWALAAADGIQADSNKGGAGQ